MLKHIFSLLFAFIAITAFAQEWKEAEEGNFTISYPENWLMEKKSEKTDSTVLFTLFSPATSGHDSDDKLVITVHEAPTITNLAEEADSTIAFLRSALTEFKLHGGPEFSQGSLGNAFAITYSDMRDQKRWKTYSAWISGGGFLYSMIFLAPETDFDTHAETVKKISFSFNESK